MTAEEILSTGTALKAAADQAAEDAELRNALGRPDDIIDPTLVVEVDEPDDEDVSDEEGLDGQGG